jgi:hypothetical protein
METWLLSLILLSWGGGKGFTTVDTEVTEQSLVGLPGLSSTLPLLNCDLGMPGTFSGPQFAYL